MDLTISPKQLGTHYILVEVTMVLLNHRIRWLHLIPLAVSTLSPPVALSSERMAQQIALFQSHQLQGVSPEQLATMRGRYIQPEGVLYFGVEMVTLWETDNQQVHQTQLNLALDFQNQAGSTVQPTVTLAVKNGQPVSGNHRSQDLNLPANNAFDEVSGGMQSVQIEGNNNAVTNNVELDIQQGPASGALEPAGERVDFSDPSALNQTMDGGGSTSVTITPERFGYTMRLSNRGEVVQSIRDQGLLQGTRLHSDNNRIANHIRIRVHRKTGLDFDFKGPKRALEQLHGIGSIGN